MDTKTPYDFFVINGTKYYGTEDEVRAKYWEDLNMSEDQIRNTPDSNFHEWCEDNIDTVEDTQEFYEWFREHTPQKNFLSDIAGLHGALYEPNGEQLTYIERHEAIAPGCVWTVFGQKGNEFLEARYIAPRMATNFEILGYLITPKPAPADFKPICIYKPEIKESIEPIDMNLLPVFKLKRDTPLAPTIRALTDGLIELTNRNPGLPHSEIVFNNDLIDEIETAYFHNAPTNPYQQSLANELAKEKKELTDEGAFHELLIRLTNVYGTISKTNEPTYTANLRRDAIVALKALNFIHIPKEIDEREGAFNPNERYIMRSEAIDAIKKLIPATI